MLMAGAFRECGLSVRDVWLDADALRACPHASPFSWDVSSKRNVVGSWPGGGGGRTLILSGHVDVVPPADASLWTSPPYEPRRDGDWLYGRGAGDMKAGLVAVAGAVRALRAAGFAPAGSVELHSVLEEECTGNGALQCLLSGAHADACVIAEPHPDHLTIAQVGVLWFHVEVAGRPVHAAYAGTGHNAIDACHTVLTELRELEAQLNADPPPPYDAIEHPINLNPGIVAGGDWASTVAARCTLSCRLAMYPGTEPSWLQAEVEAAVARASLRDPFLSSNPPVVRYDGFVCEGSVVSASSPAVGVLSEAYESVHGAPPELRPTTATTDARHYIRHGIPTVCFGPRAESIHGIDERVSVSSMISCAEVLARFIVAWCGTAAGAATA